MNVSEKVKSITPSATLAMDAKAKKMQAEGIDIIGFGAGEPDFNTPKHICDAAIAAIQSGETRYTAATGTIELRQAICRAFKRNNNLAYTPDQIVVSNGAKHSLMNAFTVLLNPGDEVIIPTPYWVSYPEMVKLADGKPIFHHTKEEHGFLIDVERLKQQITEKTKVIVVNSPSNPTGMLYSKELLAAIADLAVERGIYIISDEIYEHLIYDDKEHISIASFGEAIKDLTIVVNGVSKTYAMTGWRIGFSASSIHLAKLMASVQSHGTSNPNSIAQKATIAALDGPTQPLLEMKHAFRQRRDYMVERINSMPGVSCLEPEGAFYVMMNIQKLFGRTIEGKQINTSDDFAELLLEKAKVAVVPGTGFGTEFHVRLSYATSMDHIQTGLDRIEKFLKL